MFKRMKRIENKVEDHDKQIQQMRDDLKETRVTLETIQNMTSEVLREVKRQYKFFLVAFTVLTIILISI